MCHTKQCQIGLSYLWVEIKTKTITQSGGTEVHSVPPTFLMLIFD